MVRAVCLLWLGLLLVVTGCAAPSTLDQGYAQSPETRYRLDTGDRLRVVVFDEADLSNIYAVDDGGRISMPLIGLVSARGRTTEDLEAAIAEKLRGGYLHDPSVSVQVETYRPFFILGEVAAPGQYPYVSGMTAETAVAIAGGFSPRGVKSQVKLTRRVDGDNAEARVPIDFPVAPGDTITVIERWF